MATSKAKKAAKKPKSMSKGKSLAPVKPLLTFAKIKYSYSTQSADGTP